MEDQQQVVDEIAVQYNYALSANEKGVETNELAQKYIDAKAKLAALQKSLIKLQTNPPAPSN